MYMYARKKFYLLIALKNDLRWNNPFSINYINAQLRYQLYKKTMTRNTFNCISTG